MQCKESVDANSELFKETDDAALDKNTYEIRFCELISASLNTWKPSTPTTNASKSPSLKEYNK